jgi:uncharacterized protein YjcR
VPARYKRLTDQQKAELKQLWLAGAHTEDLALQYNVTRHSINAHIGRLVSDSEWAMRRHAPKRRKNVVRTYQALTIPKDAHPLVQRLYILCKQEQISIVQLAEKAGVSVQTINSWRTMRGSPKLIMIEYCFKVLGRRLVDRDIPENER